MARAFDLRPLEFGDHLSRAFSLYARHWLVFARWFLLVGFLPAAMCVVVLNVLLEPYAYIAHGAASEPSLLAFNSTSIYYWLVCFLSMALSQWFAGAGVMYMAARIYVGDSPGLKETAREVFGRAGWITGVMLLHLLALAAVLLVAFGPALLLGEGHGRSAGVGAWLYAVFVGAPVYFFLLALYLGRYGLNLCCVMLDDADSTSAFTRSQALSKGFRWRLYMLMLVAALLTGVPGMWSLLDLPAFLGRELLFKSSVPLAGDLVRLLWQSLLAPFFFLPLVVFFFDQRSRKEGYDLAVMATNFGIDEVELLRHQQSANLGYVPRGWKGGSLRPKAQGVAAHAAAQAQGRVRP